MPYGRYCRRVLFAMLWCFIFPLPEALARDAGFAAPQHYLDSARRALRAGDPAQTLGILGEHPEAGLQGRALAEHLGLECRARLERGDPAGARERCEQAIDADRARGRWRDYNNLGIAEFRLGHDAAARSAFEAAAVLSGVVSTPRRNLAIIDRVHADSTLRSALDTALVAR